MTTTTVQPGAAVSCQFLFSILTQATCIMQYELFFLRLNIKKRKLLSCDQLSCLIRQLSCEKLSLTCKTTLSYYYLAYGYARIIQLQYFRIQIQVLQIVIYEACRILLATIISIVLAHSNHVLLVIGLVHYIYVLREKRSQTSL